ncbi:hypothetical protein ACFW9M_18890 [Streptomyces lydicus]|uniref:hypothetical protein n=1 Tax=Streptomyces lydicus TaxID=47763 RepID=UPI00369AFEFF
MDTTPVLSDDQWHTLVAARAAYASTVSEFYDETFWCVSHRGQATGSFGKVDIGALLLWKRLRADTVWVGELMALPDNHVREVTAASVNAVRDTSLSRMSAAKSGRAALATLPGFRTGDALASALLTAAAPERMAIYDRRAHAALHTLGITVGHAPGRYGRYMDAIDQLLAHGPRPTRTWTARDMDIALYWLARPTTATP